MDTVLANLDLDKGVFQLLTYLPQVIFILLLVLVGEKLPLNKYMDELSNSIFALP